MGWLLGNCNVRIAAVKARERVGLRQLDALDLQRCAFSGGSRT